MSVGIFLLSLNLLAAPSGGNAFTPVRGVAYGNGLTWLISEARGEPDSMGRLKMAEPSGVLPGTMHFFSMDGARISAVRSIQVPVASAPKNLGEYLATLLGAEVLVETSRGGTVEGRLTACLPEGPTWNLVLDSGKERFLLPGSQVAGITLKKLGGTGAPLVPGTRQALELTLEKHGDRSLVGLEYVTDQLQWTPEYRLELSQEGGASLALVGHLRNNLEDMSGVRISFSGGAPAFSPDRLGRLSRLFFQDDPEADPVVSEGRPDLGQLLDDSVDEGASSGPGAPEKQPFFGPVDVSLAKGEQASFPLFNVPVTCNPVFLLEISEKLNPLDVGQRIWRGVRIENNTGQPLPSGPLMMVKDHLPLGQGILPATGLGLASVVRLALAEGLVARVSEKTVDSGTSYRIGGRYVHEATIQGRIELRNNTQEPATLLVGKKVPGRVDGTEPGTTSRDFSVDERSLSTSTLLHWEISLDPGKRKVLSYKYKMEVDDSAQGEQ